MGTIYISCPVTRRQVSTGIEIERHDFLYLPQVQAVMFCPDCGQQHVWMPADAELRELPPAKLANLDQVRSPRS